MAGRCCFEHHQMHRAVGEHVHHMVHLLNLLVCVWQRGSGIDSRKIALSGTKDDSHTAEQAIRDLCWLPEVQRDSYEVPFLNLFNDFKLVVA